jgi:hypothetical protein
VKGLVDENVQREIGPVLDFLRDLRAESGATVAYVHHTPHDGTRHRGSSDLEAYWESKLTLAKTATGRTLQAEHREAEAVGPFALSFGFDATTGTIRLEAEDDLPARVKAYIAKHPDASANDVVDALGGNRQRILRIVRLIREGGSGTPEPPGTTPTGSESGGGSRRRAYKAPGTTPADQGTASVPNDENQQEPGTDEDRDARAPDMPGGAIRYRESDLEAWLVERETTDAANREALTTRHRVRRQGAYGSLESDLLTTSPRLAATTEKEDL